MRNYLSKKSITNYSNLPTGEIGEKVFKEWFLNNFQGEVIHKQNADRDYQGIDFACEKGYTYQVKATRAKSYTFNCVLANANDHLNADYYVFIQIRGEYAYFEKMYTKEEILSNLNPSYKDDNSFVWAKDLLQHKVF